MKRHVKTPGRELKAVCVLLLAVAVLLGIYRGGRWLETRKNNPEPRGNYQERRASETTIMYNGTAYCQRSNLTSILLMGIDHDSGQSGGQADFLQLLVIDNTAGTVKRLPIDRDTMTPITVLGVLGNRSGVRTAQVSLSHGFGDGKEESCELTVEAVSNLLLGSSIDFYIAMNLDGISVLNDMTGGITVTLVDDFSALDPAMVQGATLTLQGDQAEIYVRSRMNVGVGTNEARMARQEQYVTMLFAQLDAQMRSDEGYSGRIFDSLSPYLTTNMGRGRVINEVWLAKDYDRVEPLRISGEHIIGSDGFMQFYPDEESLYEAVLELYYEEVK